MPLLIAEHGFTGDSIKYTQVNYLGGKVYIIGVVYARDLPVGHKQCPEHQHNRILCDDQGRVIKAFLAIP